MSNNRLARALALGFLAGPWTREELVLRAMDVVQLSGRVPDPLLHLVRLVLRVYPRPPHGRADALTAMLLRSHAFADVIEHRPRLRERHWLIPEPSMAEPVPALAQLDLPRIANESELAAFLSIMPDDLEWYADLHRLNRTARDARLRHYHYRWIRKRSGAYRLIEAPKARLKLIQRHILDHILSRVPLHDSCHGHRRGRSVVSFVTPHVGRGFVLSLDLAEFFVSVREARVRALFAALGYPDRVAALLAGMCCTPTPEDVLRARPADGSPSAIDEAFAQRQQLRSSHLPQGAPTSPALANLAAYKLDVRLASLAGTLGATYTRYADDLAFSGEPPVRQTLSKVAPLIGAIVLEEGFELRYRKTRGMTQSQRQRLCGVVLNEAPSLPRRELEQLEAILVNCVRHGPESQNRAQVADFRGHLRGRIAWVTQLNPRKGAYLAELFAQIVFDDAEAVDRQR